MRAPASFLAHAPPRSAEPLQAELQRMLSLNGGTTAQGAGQQPLDPEAVTQDGERCAEELWRLASEALAGSAKDDILPSIGAQGVARRRELLAKADRFASEAARLAEEAEERMAEATAAEEAAAEAARALLPPEHPEGAETEEEADFLKSDSEPEGPSPEAAEKVDRLAADAAVATGRETRSLKAAQKVAEAARLLQQILADAEAEEAKRKEAAARVAGFWEAARSEEAKCAVIWMHGQGESEAAWQVKLAEFNMPKHSGPCRWIWPRADLQRCSTRGGVLTPQWFDTPEFPVCSVVRGVPDRPRRDEDPAHVALAVRRVHAAIEALEAEGLPSHRIALAGFGQGAALVVHAVLRFQRPLAGGAVLSGWVPCYEVLARAADEAAPPGGRVHVPELLWCHGAQDCVVEPQLAVSQAKALEELGTNVDFRLFPELAFGVNAEVITTLHAWLVERLTGHHTPNEDEVVAPVVEEGSVPASRASRREASEQAELHSAAPASRDSRRTASERASGPRGSAPASRESRRQLVPHSSEARRSPGTGSRAG